MAVNLSDMLKTPSEDEILDGFLSLLIVAGFPVTSWQPGGVARTIARLLARGLAQVAGLLVLVARGGFNSTATGDWLSLLSRELYDNERLGATFASGQVKLVLSSALAGPYTLTPGQLWFQWNGRRYRSTSGGTITYPTPLVVSFAAESPGAKYNAPDNLLQLLTPMPGLLVAASVVTTQGTNAELDPSLQARNRGKWSALGGAMNNAGWDAVTRAASVLVTHVRVQANTPTGKHVRITVAGPSGALDPAALALLQTILDLRAPCNVIPTVVNATEQTVSLVGTIRIQSAHPNSGQAFSQVIDTLLALFAALPIGGTLRLSDLYQVIEGIPGVDSSLLSAPVGDLTIGASSVAIADLTGLGPEYF